MKCWDCRTFSARFGFRYTRYSRAIITECIFNHFSGMSARKIVGSLEMRGIKTDRSAAVRWIERYGPAAACMDKQRPETGNGCRADEIYAKVVGDLMCLFASMDNDARHWPAARRATTRPSCFRVR